MSYCIKCGEQLDDDAKFCMKCGTQIQYKELEDKELGNTSPESNDNRIKSKKKSLIIGMAVFAFVIFVMFCQYFSTGYICSWCGEQHYGTSYYDCFDPEVTFCRDCAKEYYTFAGYQNYKN